MLLPDVNVLVYAYREDAPDHAMYHRWLHEEVNSAQAFGISEQVLSGFMRVVTHPRVFSPPSPIIHALGFADALKTHPNTVGVRPGARHWAIFSRVLVEADARGNLVPDAWFAALAIEHACTWMTADRDFARFPGLDWRHPMQDKH